MDDNFILNLKDDKQNYPFTDFNYLLKTLDNKIVIYLLK